MRPSRIVTPMAGAIVQVSPYFLSVGQSCGAMRSKPWHPRRAASRHVVERHLGAGAEHDAHQRLLDAAFAGHDRRRGLVGARRTGGHRGADGRQERSPFHTRVFYQIRERRGTGNGRYGGNGNGGDGGNGFTRRNRVTETN